MAAYAGTAPYKLPVHGKYTAHSKRHAVKNIYLDNSLYLLVLYPGGILQRNIRFTAVFCRIAHPAAPFALAGKRFRVVTLFDVRWFSNKFFTNTSVSFYCTKGKNAQGIGSVDILGSYTLKLSRTCRLCLHCGTQKPIAYEQNQAKLLQFIT